MLDLLIYGNSMEDSFRYALENAPKNSDAGSSKEVNTSLAGGIEWFSSEHDPQVDAAFDYDFKKLTMILKNALFEERSAKTKGKDLSKGALEEIRFQVDLDMEIFELFTEGVSDPEILDKIGFSCSRQALTSRRHRILKVAKTIFADLQH